MGKLLNELMAGTDWAARNAPARRVGLGDLHSLRGVARMAAGFIDCISIYHDGDLLVGFQKDCPRALLSERTIEALEKALGAHIIAFSVRAGHEVVPVGHA